LEEDFGYTPSDEDAPDEYENHYDELPNDYLYDEDGQGELFQVDPNPTPLSELHRQMKHDDTESISDAVKRFNKRAISWESVELIVLNIWDRAYQEGSSNRPPC
jgi:hypothetical protein